MHRTDHLRFCKRHDFVPDFSHAERRTRIVMGITAAMMVVEIVAGLMSHSMAFLADGWQMRPHVLAFLITADAFASGLAGKALTGGKFFGWAWLGPFVGIVGRVVVFSWAYTLLRDTSGILLDRTPLSSDLPEEIRRAVQSDGDSVVTDLHVWQVGIGKFAAMVSIVAHEPKRCDSYRALLRGCDDLVHVTIVTHHRSQAP